MNIKHVDPSASVFAAALFGFRKFIKRRASVWNGLRRAANQFTRSMSVFLADDLAVNNFRLDLYHTRALLGVGMCYKHLPLAPCLLDLLGSVVPSPARASGRQQDQRVEHIEFSRID